MSKPPINIVRVRINDHVRIYDETVEVLGRSFAELGHVCTLSENLFLAGCVNVVTGSIMPGSRHYRIGPKLAGLPYVAHQTEQLHPVAGHLRGWPEYSWLLRGAVAIIEYAPFNYEQLIAAKYPNAYLVPPGYHACLETFPAAKQDIDVVLIGSDTPRRRAVTAALSDLRVEYLSNHYGAERDAILARARIVLNVHALEISVLETIRMQLLLANECFVISETSDHNPFGEGIVLADHEDLAAACRDYLALPDERERIAQAGYEALRSMPFVDALSRIVVKEEWIADREVGLV